ncbi:MAG: VTT domain-containing protein [Candidatus Omnitrophota bacterium]
MENKKHKHRIKFLVLVIFLLLLWYMGRYLHIDTDALENSFRGFPLLYSTALYVILYVIVTFFIFFSKDIFWVAGAVAFGAYLSTLLVVIAEVINAFILFHLARYLGRNFVAHYAKEKSGSLDERLANINFFWLFIIRLVPLIPYRFLDLGAGLTRIHFRRYLIAVLLATPLRALWVQYILAVVGKNIFGNPKLLAVYLLENKALFIVSLIYLILIFAVVLKLKRKG